MKRFKCDQCEKEYNRPSLLAQHVRTHTGERPFKCSECDAAFTRKAHLDSHMRSHTSERAFVCSECGKGVHTKQHLERHMNLHRKQHQCEQCGEAFRMKIQLDRHVLRHSLTCVCGQNFRTPSLLSRHRKPDKQYKCTRCEHVAECPLLLSAHYKVHRDEKLAEVAHVVKNEALPLPLPLPPSVDESEIAEDIDPDLLSHTDKRPVKRPRNTGKTAIGLLTGSTYAKRPIPCPVPECPHRANRMYDMARHIATMHPGTVGDDLKDDEDTVRAAVEAAEAATAAEAANANAGNTGADSVDGANQSSGTDQELKQDLQDELLQESIEASLLDNVESKRLKL